MKIWALIMASALCLGRDGSHRTPSLWSNPRNLIARAGTDRKATAEHVILFWNGGGMSHIDTFDPKPDAPDGIRGEFKTIPTVLPGIRVCEHLPMLQLA